MKMTPVGKVAPGQDGAIFGGFLFRFDAAGNCRVHSLCDLSEVGSFRLDKADILCPHSNAVMFGNEYYCPEDEFPILYSNIYNTYAKAEDKMKGVTCVYRIQKEGYAFTSTLVQIIEVGFTEDTPLWKSPNVLDVRPYGNFVIDRELSLYYASTMCDELQISRYFAFPLPKLSEGILDEKFGVKRVVLSKEDITDQFDCEYHRYVQGAICQKGKIYSLEGFTNNEANPPALRILDPASHCQLAYIPFAQFGTSVEPELIDFADGICYYCDCRGNLYTLEF